MTINNELDKAYEAQIVKMYEIFINSVASAQDKEHEMVAALERFRKGVDIAKRVLVKAKEIAGVEHRDHNL